MFLYFDISTVNRCFIAPAQLHTEFRGATILIARTRPPSTVTKGLVLLKITNIVANFNLKSMHQTDVLTQRDGDIPLH